MTPDEFAARMAEIRDDLAVQKDAEYPHIEADELMCLALRSLGYGKGVDIYEKIDKWYA